MWTTSPIYWGSTLQNNNVLAICSLTLPTFRQPRLRWFDFVWFYPLLNQGSFGLVASRMSTAPPKNIYLSQNWKDNFTWIHHTNLPYKFIVHPILQTFSILQNQFSSFSYEKVPLLRWESKLAFCSHIFCKVNSSHMMDLLDYTTVEPNKIYNNICRQLPYFITISLLTLTPIHQWMHHRNIN